MAGRNKKASTRPHTAAASRNTKSEEIDPYVDDEGVKTAIVWVLSRASHKLPKVVIREVCSYLHEEIVIVYCNSRTTLDVYDILLERNQSVELKPKNSIPLFACSAPIDNSRIFFCGGSNCHTGAESLTKESALMVHTDGTVEVLRSMRSSRFQHAVAVYRKRVLVFGGTRSHTGKMRPLADCEEFSMQSSRWEAVPTMHFARSWCSATRLGDSMYLFGGDQFLRIEVYALLTHSFRVTELILPSTNMCAGFAVHGEVVILQASKRITISREGGNDTMKVTEETARVGEEQCAKYWRERVYYYGKVHSYWINSNNPSEFHEVNSIFYQFVTD